MHTHRWWICKQRSLQYLRAWGKSAQFLSSKYGRCTLARTTDLSERQDLLSADTWWGVFLAPLLLEQAPFLGSHLCIPPLCSLSLPASHGDGARMDTWPHLCRSCLWAALLTRRIETGHVGGVARCPRKQRLEGWRWQTTPYLGTSLPLCPYVEAAILDRPACRGFSVCSPQVLAVALSHDEHRCLVEMTL